MYISLESVGRLLPKSIKHTCNLLISKTDQIFASLSSGAAASGRSQ